MEQTGRTDRLGDPFRRHIAISQAKGQQRSHSRLHRIRQIGSIGKLGQRGVERRQTTLTAKGFGHRLLDQRGFRENSRRRLGRCRGLDLEKRTGRHLLGERPPRLTGVRLDFTDHRRQRADRHGHAPGEGVSEKVL
jgi:hypothetical protein